MKDESTLYGLNVFGTEEFEPSDVSGKTASLSSVDGEDCFDVDNTSEQAEDIWDIESLSKPQNEKVILRSWDTFPEHPFTQRQPVSLSEAGPRGFDAALAFQAGQTGLEDSGRVCRSEPFIWSLFKLGLGWNSLFFRFNEQTRRFEKHMKDARIPGISLPTLDSLVQEFLEYGTHVRSIRRFIARVPSSASLSALSRASFVLLYSLESQLFERFKAGTSLLELQELFRRCGCLLRCMHDVTNTASNAYSDAGIVSAVFSECDRCSQQFVWLAGILHEIMAVVARPRLCHIASWIGIQVRHHKFALGADDSGSDRLFLEVGDIPDFVPPEHVERILESGRILRLLRKFDPTHPLAKKTDSATVPSLASFECAVTWDEVDRIQRKAHDYETHLRLEILKYRQTHESHETCEGNSSEKYISDDAPQDEPEALTENIYGLSDLDMPMDEIKSVETWKSISSQKLYQLLADSGCLSPSQSLEAEAPFGPPLSISAYLSFAPIISAQTRLVNFSCLQLLFKAHKLRDHLQLQWRFQLLGDSTFMSRIAHTLFNPNMDSGERKAGVARGGLSTGLRLGSRDTWPPASSELRLVLMGMLTECYDNGNKDHHTGKYQDSADDRHLPGGLSFAIRELTDEEMAKCKNPHSIEALDFLRLQYNAPPVLDEIITLNSLEKYDRLFKHLLRLTRMQSVVRSLLRDATNRHTSVHDHTSIERRFRFEASHFIHSVSDYAFSVCVADTWGKFERSLRKIEQCIDDGDFDGTLECAEGPARLREYHEATLDQMLMALFLTKKHAQVSKQLDHIFGIILAYASLSKPTGVRDGKKSGSRYERSVRQLYADFRKHVGGFVRFLRISNGGKFTTSRAKHQDQEALTSRQESDVEVHSVFAHLLLRLDMKEYY